MRKILLAIVALLTFSGASVVAGTGVVLATPTNCGVHTYIYTGGSNTTGVALHCATQGPGSFTLYRAKVRCLNATSLGGNGSTFYTYGQWRTPGPKASYGTSIADCRNVSASGVYLSHSFSYT